MSKSAVYAGLGKGLMALGQGVGRAIETTQLEKLRQQNLEQNWARQDAMRSNDLAIRKNERAQDMALRKSERAEDLALKERSLSAQEKQNESLMKLNRDKFEYEQTRTNLPNTPAAIQSVRHIAQSRGITEGEAWEFYKGQAGQLPEREKMRLDILSKELETVIEISGDDSERAKKIRGQIDSILANDPLGLL